MGFIASSDFNINSFFELLFSEGSLGPINGEDVYGHFLGESGPELIIGGTDRRILVSFREI
jgi:hypothetical protein